MRLFASIVIAGAFLAGPNAVFAAPVPDVLTVPAVPSAAPLLDVRDGCGPFRHRGPYGYCRPNGPPPRPFYRACPFGFHMTPYGCRRNY